MSSAVVQRDESLIGNVHRLLGYLREYVQLRTTTVRHLRSYERQGVVVWFDDVPIDADCHCCAWTGEEATEQEDGIWLQVKKQTLPQPPLLPDLLKPWLNDNVGSDATEEPALLSEALLPRGDVTEDPFQHGTTEHCEREPTARVDAADDHASEVESGDVCEPDLTIRADATDDDRPEVDPGDVARLEVHRIEDHPEVQNAWKEYLKRWRAWAEEYSRALAIQRIYEKLFRIHRQQARLGEAFELIVGIGCLGWSPETDRQSRAVLRHVLVARAELELSHDTGLLTVHPAPPPQGAEPHFELDMLEETEQPLADELERLRLKLSEMGEDLWTEDSIHELLSTMANVLHARGAYDESLSPPGGLPTTPRIHLAPAVILRPRNTRGLLHTYDRLLKNLETSEVPFNLARLVDHRDDDLGEPRDGQDFGSSGYKPRIGSTRHYLPLEANRDQQRILQALERRRGILVQGPPGTGKSHTIANLLCHLLATGQRVLVTSETEKALRVLKEKLPPEIRPLCVSLLGADRDSFSELEACVRGITRRHTTWSDAINAQATAECERRLDALERERSKVRNTLLTLREAQIKELPLGSLGKNNKDYRGTASAVAARLRKDQVEYEWCEIPGEPQDEPPLSDAEACELLSLLRSDNTDSEIAAKGHMVGAESIPSAIDFREMVQREKSTESEVRTLDADLRDSLFHTLCRAGDDELRELRTGLSECLRVQRGLSLRGHSWATEAFEKVVSGRGQVWDTRLTIDREILPRIREKAALADAVTVEKPNDIPEERLLEDAKSLLDHLREGGSWGLPLLRPRALRGRTYVRKCSVNGERVTNDSALRRLIEALEIRTEFDRLWRLWSEVAAPGSRLLELQFAELLALHETLESVYSLVAVHTSINRLPSVMTSGYSLAGDIDEVRRWLDALDRAEIRREFENARSRLESIENILVTACEEAGHHPVNERLLSALRDRNVDAWTVARSELAALYDTRTRCERRDALLERLREEVPAVADRLNGTSGDKAWDARFEKLSRAWTWVRASYHFERINAPGRLEELLREHRQVEHEILNVLAQLSALKAWSHLFQHLTQKQRESLESWRQAVKALGKGTGKSARAERLRSSARHEMQNCVDAIPVWILPRYRVSDMVPPTPERFDVVIIDEASQTGIEGLFLFFLARKVVVVGDDQQISPPVGFVREDIIQSLQNRFLEDLPHNHLLAPGRSIYDHAKVRFTHGQLMLQEHFRCVPEIIQFSNQLCYAAHGAPLDPLRAPPPNRLEPLVTRHVATGYREGEGTNTQNRPEAEAVVEQIKACCEDSRYDGKSMGVISLLGETQARVIENLLIQHVGPEQIEIRNLTCGDAYAFQGDERDVIFLSMVSATNTRMGVLSKDADKQRFNVAASRARDQLWLFHSVELRDLSPRCVRRALLSYMQAPSVSTDELEESRFDSQFEKDVFNQIRMRGYRVRTQVSVGDATAHQYRIDLVVEGMQGRLAVECDGDHWHGPERYEADMARQRDLERAGLDFFRIRGSDFYRNPERALEPLWKELEERGILPGGIDSSRPLPPQRTPLNVTKDDEEDCCQSPSGVTEYDLFAGGEADIHNEAGDQKATRPSDCGSVDADPVRTPASVTASERKPLEAEAQEVPVDPRSGAMEDVIESLLSIVAQEGPMTCQHAYRVYREAAGIQRLGKVLRRVLNKAASAAVRRGRLLEDAGRPKRGQIYKIVRIPGTPPVAIRSRGTRRLEEIPRNEIRALAERIRCEHSDVDQDRLLQLLFDHYDVRRVSAKSKDLFREHLRDTEFDRTAASGSALDSPEASGPSSDDALDISDEITAEVRSLPAEDWFRLSHWAKINEHFQSWERSLLYSIGRRMQNGTSLTRKQIFHAHRVLREAMRLGFHRERS